ncbi:MAG: NADH-quinone oxidoreductase subunit NuoB [Candidatus Micrarchaeaceae archaeon]
MDQKGEEYGSKEEMKTLVEDSLTSYSPRVPAWFTTIKEISKALAKGPLIWSRVNSLWPVQFGLACCAMELFDFGSPRIDAERRGYLLFRATPRQSDVMLVAGWITKNMIPEVKRLYEQMASPKYVIAYGECATCGGPWWESYNIIKGIDQVLPVDVYVAGCPPKPENLYMALVRLQEKIGGKIEDRER